MSAIDELRAAATVERAEWGGALVARQFGTSAAIHLAVADLLDAHADDFDWDEEESDNCCGPEDVCWECSRNKAVLKVARAINEGTQ